MEFQEKLNDLDIQIKQLIKEKNEISNQLYRNEIDMLLSQLYFYSFQFEKSDNEYVANSESTYSILNTLSKYFDDIELKEKVYTYKNNMKEIHNLQEKQENIMNSFFRKCGSIAGRGT